MKRFLIAAALAFAAAGTAMAQDAKTTQPPITGTPEADSSISASTTGTQMPATGTGQVVGDMALSNPAPAAGSYPPCRHRGQDRCVVTSQLKHHMTTASRRHKSSTRTGA